MDEPPLASRPRPPRSRSGRLGSSQSSGKASSNNITALDAFLPLERVGDNTNSTRLNASHLALIGALEPLTPPATPPMDTCAPEMQSKLSQVSSSRSEGNLSPFRDSQHTDVPPRKHSREISHENVRSSEELENMLEEARRIIQERETGM